MFKKLSFKQFNKHESQLYLKQAVSKTTTSMLVSSLLRSLMFSLFMLVLLREIKITEIIKIGTAFFILIFLLDVLEKFWAKLGLRKAPPLPERADLPRKRRTLRKPSKQRLK